MPATIAFIVRCKFKHATLVNIRKRTIPHFVPHDVVCDSPPRVTHQDCVGFRESFVNGHFVCVRFSSSDGVAKTAHSTLFRKSRDKKYPRPVCRKSTLQGVLCVSPVERRGSDEVRFLKGRSWLRTALGSSEAKDCFMAPSRTIP